MVRGDVGDLSQAQAVVVVSHMVVLIIAPPGSSIDSMDNLKGRTVGVVGGTANAKIVDVLTKEYDLARAKVVFKNLALTDVRQAIQSKQVSALLVVIPLAEKYLSLVRGFFQLDRKKVADADPNRVPRQQLQRPNALLKVSTSRRARCGGRRRSRKMT